MSPQRWRQVEDLYHAVLERAPGERALLLEQADPELRREVESLLAQPSRNSALERPAWVIFENPGTTGTLSAGFLLGPYRIEAPIGKGGMGEVWKAHDTRLNRTVAIKRSAWPFTDRFGREACAVAALNHSNICHLYDVGPDYLVMEYVEGTPIKGPLPIEQVLKYADQICDALDAAHRKGITHRDLKPANILVSKQGIKLLDFGIARMEAGPNDPTLMDRTQTGIVMGTPAYMAPEQLEGKTADARSDIYSFGCVLYEMLTGKRAAGDRAPAAPPLEQIIRTCLERDPDERWQSAREVRHALKWTTAETPPRRVAAKSVRLWRGLAASFILVALGMTGRMFWSDTPAQISRFEAPFPEKVTPTDYVSVSPDGRKLVFSTAGEGGLWIRNFDALEWHRLPGTEGASSPFWSPDSRYLAFAVGNQVKKMDTTAGGPAETLCMIARDAAGSGTWNRNGVIVFGSWGGGSGGPLWKVSQAGGTATAVTQVDVSKGELYHTWPTFLPDGEHFIYFRSGPSAVAGIYAGSLAAKPAEQSRERILASELPASWANGYLFFLRANTLLAQPLAARRLQLQGTPVPLAEAVRTTWYGTGIFSVSPSGYMAYRTSLARANLRATWVDRRGKTISTLGLPSGSPATIVLSPDGKSAVLKDTPYGEPGDLWTIDFATGRLTRLTFRKDVYSPGVWSPDGARIAYVAGNLGDTLYDRASTGAGDERELLKESGLRHFATSWSRDGRFLLYHTENAPRTGYDLWVLPLRSQRKPVLLLGEAFNEWGGVFSPDMRWIAYASLETGGPEVYVRPFRVSEQTGLPTLGEGRWQVSKGGGNWPWWRSGNEIIFDNSPSGTAIFTAPVRISGAVFESGVPQQLFAGPVLHADSTPDGQRFLLVAPEILSTARSSISVVLNWPALLKRK